LLVIAILNSAWTFYPIGDANSNNSAQKPQRITLAIDFYGMDLFGKSCIIKLLSLKFDR